MHAARAADGPEGALGGLLRRRSRLVRRHAARRRAADREPCSAARVRGRRRRREHREALIAATSAARMTMRSGRCVERLSALASRPASRPTIADRVAVVATAREKRIQAPSLESAHRRFASERSFLRATRSIDRTLVHAFSSNTSSIASSPRVTRHAAPRQLLLRSGAATGRRPEPSSARTGARSSRRRAARRARSRSMAASTSAAGSPFLIKSSPQLDRRSERAPRACRARGRTSIDQRGARDLDGNRSIDSS